MCKTIGILSLKGGVGKTATVASLGSALSELGKRVLLVDGNFSAPNLGIHLNVINPDTTIHHVLSGNASTGDAIQGMEDFGFDLIPASVFPPREINFMKLKDKLKNVKDNYDFIIIDSSPALNDETLAVMLAADELFIVTTADYPTLSMTLKSIKEAKSRGIRIDGIIMNKVYGKPFELSIKDVEDTADVPVMAVIPQDVNVAKSVSQFTPAYIQNPRSRGSKEYRKLAGVIADQKYQPRLFGFRRFLKFVPVAGTPRHQDVNRELYYKRVFG